MLSASDCIYGPLLAMITVLKIITMTRRTTTIRRTRHSPNCHSQLSQQTERLPHPTSSNGLLSDTENQHSHRPWFRTKPAWLDGYVGLRDRVRAGWSCFIFTVTYRKSLVPVLLSVPRCWTMCSASTPRCLKAVHRKLGRRQSTSFPSWSAPWTCRSTSATAPPRRSPSTTGSTSTASCLCRHIPAG